MSHDVTKHHITKDNLFSSDTELHIFTEKCEQYEQYFQALPSEHSTLIVAVTYLGLEEGLKQDQFQVSG